MDARAGVRQNPKDVGRVGNGQRRRKEKTLRTKGPDLGGLPAVLALPFLLAGLAHLA